MLSRTPDLNHKHVRKAAYRSTAPPIRIELFERSRWRRLESFSTSARTISRSRVTSLWPAVYCQPNANTLFTLFWKDDNVDFRKVSKCPRRLNVVTSCSDVVVGGSGLLCELIDSFELGGRLWSVNLVDCSAARVG
jgi:hypothetical protein